MDEESGGTRLDDRQIRDEAMTLMLAGHDTTAAGLDWLWYSIACFPEVARRCQEEVDSVVGGREPNASDLDQLPYLVATITLHQALGLLVSLQIALAFPD